MNKKIGMFVLFVVLFSIFSIQYVVGWWDENYFYYKNITITAVDAVAGNFTTNMTIDTATLISDSKMSSDCSDLRVIFNHSEEIQRIVYDCNTGASNVTWKVNRSLVATETDKNYSIYYGYSSASMPSFDYDNIYLLNDTFDATHNWGSSDTNIFEVDTTNENLQVRIPSPPASPWDYIGKSINMTFNNTLRLEMNFSVVTASSGDGGWAFFGFEQNITHFLDGGAAHPMINNNPRLYIGFYYATNPWYRVHLTNYDKNANADYNEAQLTECGDTAYTPNKNNTLVFEYDPDFNVSHGLIMINITDFDGTSNCRAQRFIDSGQHFTVLAFSERSSGQGLAMNVSNTFLRTNITNSPTYSLSTEKLNSITINNCTGVSGATAIIFRMKNETDRTSMYGTMEISFQLYSEDWSETKTYGFKETNDTFDYCIAPETETGYANIYIRYWNDTSVGTAGSNYPVRTYYIDNTSISNTTQYVDLYLLNSVEALEYP